MDRESPDTNGYKLESQIREAYGRVVYSATCHNKMADRLLKNHHWIKIWQIILSAVTTGSFLVVIFGSEKAAGYIGAVISVILLVLNAYTKDFELVENAQIHQKAANSLWVVREEYVSLLTDFDMLEAADIIQKRDELQVRTADIYLNFPKTDQGSYKEAQRVLKTEEEQTFSEKEIDVMLPNSIRRSKRK